MNKADTLFSEADKRKISATIKTVEEKTAGEVAVMVVDQSDSYPEAAILGGVMLGGLGGLLVTDFLFHDSLWYFVPVAFVLALLAGWILQKIPTALRFFVPADRLEERVRNRALRAFYEQGLYKTRDNTGVLFFISLFEHKVWVLADEGIYEKIDQEELSTYAAEVATAVKSGRACAGLCQQIEKVGEILAHHFPIKDDDTDELSNIVITG